MPLEMQKFRLLHVDKSQEVRWNLLVDKHYQGLSITVSEDKRVSSTSARSETNTDHTNITNIHSDSFVIKCGFRVNHAYPSQFGRASLSSRAIPSRTDRNDRSPDTERSPTCVAASTRMETDG